MSGTVNGQIVCGRCGYAVPVDPHRTERLTMQCPRCSRRIDYCYKNLDRQRKDVVYVKPQS